MRTRIASLVLAATVAASDAAACGACLEDKIAATYDYAVIQQAAAQGDVVVFCELGGTVDASRLRAAARRVRGLDAASMRIAEAPPALSFALDGARESPQDAVSALQRAVPDTRITIIRLIASSTEGVPTR